MDDQRERGREGEMDELKNGEKEGRMLYKGVECC